MTIYIKNFSKKNKPVFLKESLLISFKKINLLINFGYQNKVACGFI